MDAEKAVRKPKGARTRIPEVSAAGWERGKEGERFSGRRRGHFPADRCDAVYVLHRGVTDRVGASSTKTP